MVLIRSQTLHCNFKYQPSHMQKGRASQYYAFYSMEGWFSLSISPWHLVYIGYDQSINKYSAAGVIRSVQVYAKEVPKSGDVSYVQ